MSIRAEHLNHIYGEGTALYQFLAYLIGILVAFLGAAILTYFVGFEDMEKKAESEESIKIEKGSIRITSPVEGEAIKLEDVKDEVFSSEAMGKGFAVMPTTGEVLAPEDCTVSVIFPTKHAIGLTLDSGIELLIHIGMNTVDLNGKFFEQHVQAGMHVTKGTKIVSFDKEAIEKAGYDVTVPVVVSNSNLFKSIETISNGHVDENIEVICVEIK